MGNISTNTQNNKNRGRLVQRFLQIVSNLSRSFLVSFFGIIVNYILLRYKAGGILTTYVYSISIINFLFVFSNWGGKDYITKAYAKEPFAIKELTAGLLGSKLLAACLLIPFVFLLPVDLTVKCFIATYLLLKTFSQVYEALIVLRKKYHLSLAIDSVLSFGLLLIIFNDGNKDNPTVFLMELLILELLRIAFYFVMFRAEMALTLNNNACLQVIKKSSLFFYISLAGFLCSKADLYVTGFFLGKQSMSIYYIITNLVSFSLIAYATINGTFVAGILRYNQKVFGKFVQSSVYTGFIFSLLSALAVYVLCTYYFRLTLSAFFCTLIIANVFGFTRVLMQMYRYTRLERQDLVLRCLLISGLANVLSACLLTKMFGHTGAFAANTLAVYINLILLQKMYKETS